MDFNLWWATWVIEKIQAIEIFKDFNFLKIFFMVIKIFLITLKKILIVSSLDKNQKKKQFSTGF